MSDHSTTVGETITSDVGELVVLETWRALKSTKSTQTHTFCRVKCFCGNIFEAHLGNIKNKHTRSCGCYNSKRTSESSYKHGHTGWNKKLNKNALTPTYTSWSTFKNRCLNKNNQHYHKYGGRGIKLFEGWLQFENFLRDMGEKPLGFRLKRLDKDGNFEPSNCDWVPRKKKEKG